MSDKRRKWGEKCEIVEKSQVLSVENGKNLEIILVIIRGMCYYNFTEKNIQDRRINKTFTKDKAILNIFYNKITNHT